MSMNKIGSISGDNILLLQGPIGPFFTKLDLHFRTQGANTFKIALNAGDWLFSNKDTVYSFKGKREEWDPFIRDFLSKKAINKIFLFGDCRFYQSHTIKTAKELNLDVFVFEEGYLRPDFITLERDGVNHYSSMKRDAEFYLSLDESYLNIPASVTAKPLYRWMAFSAIFYYIAMHFFSFCYPNYIHHRESSAIKEFFWWWRNVFRKLKYRITERNLLDRVTGELSLKYYFVPLQTYNDFQLTQHSSFRTIEEFIEKTLNSFASHAPKETFLVLKHHPADRGRKDYSHFITKMSQTLKISSRVIVMHDLHLPSCLQHAIGTITINSTVGMSSLINGTPTIVLGKAIYDIEGMTNKGMKLDMFWDAYKKPNRELVFKFRNYLRQVTQLNGSFYGKFPIEFSKGSIYQEEKDKIS